MPEKRPPSPSPSLIPNPFIKKRNLEWTLDPPSTPEVLSAPPAPLSYASLFVNNAGSPRGAHFVIHQHDHPVAGTHYDLRLQINETSSASWAIMYGLPGDPNSMRLNRNATETRIHCLWNHLIETASSSTGSLLIWDTGTYTILPRKSKHSPSSDPSSPPSSPSSPSSSTPTPQALLYAAFQNRNIRIRLHGSRLPDPYVLNLRLTKSEDIAGRARSGRTPRTRRLRRGGGAMQPQPETSDEEETDTDDEEDVPGNPDAGTNVESLSVMERELRELEDEEVRQTNAYSGASNTIGSVHQRRWYLSLDRPACGFVERRTKGRSVWEMDKDAQDQKSVADQALDGSAVRLSYPFYVRGPEHERSVVTGRHGANILKDEGVDDFVQRKGWKPVLK
ncbi:ABC1 domain containing [Fusarium albosuccineum]|uniref:ABC1 domain containing n=1 Tax=Fusarium albosuccineum TaxID=1237068 RepID=A0A8H4P9V3_9HYPO|nr:ABC1 domain containing [Fusarium albosuccineum]